ncbi:MAG: ABC transporter ATP-binding protein [Candidatus Omnitrophica bacterium]|nr:ABC transporter ATP-binding protein [Candidatus Omnitrophota bacterium]
MDAPIVAVENITKVFKDQISLPVRALTDVSFQIQEGEFVALCGPSGSGKTTLLNLIGCLDQPTRGKVFFDGEEISRLGQQALTRYRLEKIGFIFQDYNLIPTLTALENIEYVLWLQGIPSAQRRKRALVICERFGIAKLVTRRPPQLSRGQQQRAAVARAVIHKPRIVLGDELTANLDHKTGTELMDFLKELNREEKITFIYATHDPMIMARASRVIRLEDGQLVDDLRQY